MGVRYRLIEPGRYSPPDSHNPVGDDEYIAPTADGLDTLETQGVVDVLDWEYENGHETVEFDGPAEPIVVEEEVNPDDDEDNRTEPTIKIKQPVEGYNPNGDPSPMKTIPLGKWVCMRCGTETIEGVRNGEVQEPQGECDNCERQGPFEHVGGLSDDDIQVALRAGEMWHPPAGVSDDGYGELWADIREFVRDHWDAGTGDDADAIYAGLTAYVLSTWVRPNLTFVPHLMLMGKTTGGKTRLLNTLARVSYRAVVSASATPASMFRLVDGYDVSYFISEYHGLDRDAQRELDNIVRAGQKRGEKVTRAEPTSTGHEPRVYDPFTHVAVATQFTPDDDIVNRCIQVRSSAPNRDMPATLDDDRARDLRDRLLYARFRLLDSDEWRKAEGAAYEYLAEHSITGRTREKLLSLVTVAVVWDRLDDLDPFVDVVVQQDREAAADSDDALVVEVVRNAAHEAVGEVTVLGNDPYSAVEIPYSDVESGTGVLERYEEMTGVEESPSWLGHVVKRLGLEKERTREGTVISDPDLGPKLRELCDDLNLDWRPDDDTSQADAVRRVRTTVDRLEGEFDDGHVPRDAVVDELDGELGGRDPEHLIDRALEAGEFYEPEEGHLATT